MKLIHISDMDFSYDTASILKDINLEIYKGKIYSIIGPNGSGKTTLLSILAKFLQTDRGSISFKDKDLKKIKISEFAKEVATVKQKNNIDYDFTVKDIVLMGRAPYKKAFEGDNQNDYDLADEAMELTGVDMMKDKPITKLSGGELQRVILARAITQQTGILLLDEPISSLDIKHQLKFMGILKQLSIEKGITIINIIHDLNLALSYSDEGILMKDGRIFTKGRIEEVLTKENIQLVYEVDSTVIKHPKYNKNVILFN